MQVNCCRQFLFQCNKERPYHLPLDSKFFLMSKQESEFLCHSCIFGPLPPFHELVSWYPYHKPLLLCDKKDTPREPNPPHECNALMQINQHKKVSIEEIIHWYFHLLPPQAHISLPNQNQTLNLFTLWEIRAYLADGPAGVDIPWYAPCRGTKSGPKLCHLSCKFFYPLEHKSTWKYVGCTGEWKTTQKKEIPRRNQNRDVITQAYSTK